MTASGSAEASPPVVDLLVIGDANPDVILRGAPRGLPYGQAELLAEAGVMTVGGSGAIAACGAARLGLRTAFVGVVGDDAAGRFMLDELRLRCIDVEGCHVSANVPTGISVCLVREDDRTILTAQGTIFVLEAAMIDSARLRAARHVHVSSYFLQAGLRPGLRDVLAVVHAAGGTTSLDTNWDPAERWDGGLNDVLSEVDVLFVNESEALAIAGVSDVEAALTVLAARGGQPVVKRGAEGAVAYPGCRIVRATAPTVGVVDTIGAGDSFDAGYLYGLVHDWPAERCVALAVACGSLSTRGAGGVVAQPTLDEAVATAGI